MTRTIVAIYGELATAQHVVEDLVNAGVARDNISLVANDIAGNYSPYVGRTSAATEDVVDAGDGASFGAVVGGLTGVLVGLGALAIPGIGPVLAAGPLLAALGGGAVGAVAGAATGGIVAGLVKTGIPEDEAHDYAEGVRRGGTLLTVSTPDNLEHTVYEILNRHNPIDLEQRTEAWRKAGWKTFGETDQPYSVDDISRESEAYRDAARTGRGARTYNPDQSARV